jgi:hypothetical protein
MMWRRREEPRADRLTLALAALALGTVGTVIGGQFARMVRRRVTEQAPPDSGVLESAELALGAAGKATQDTVTVAVEGYSETPRGETIVFNILNGFIAGFALMRLSTWGIRGGWWPAGNVRVGGRHVHHFVPGILIAFAAGGTGLVTQSQRLETALAVPFGAGIGMTFDEAALLLELDDVYWSREGVLSVQVSLGMTAILATTLIALRMLRRGEKVSEEAGLIPDESGEYVAIAFG